MRNCGVALALALGCGPVPETGAMSGTSSTSTSDPSTSTTTTSTTTTSTTTSTDESSTSTTRRDVGDWPPGFILDPDGPVSIECSLWDQNCPPGEKCMPWSANGDPTWNATRCFPIAPDPQQPGEPCTVEGSGVSGVDDCDIASMCWNVDPETNMGHCVAFCVGSENDPICTEPNHDCSISGAGIPILCLPTCNPLVQDCPEGEGCWGVVDNFVCAVDASGEMGVFGDPCGYINACDPGLYCAAASAVPDCDSSGCCSPYCALDRANTCPGEGQECLPAFEPGTAPPPYDNVGLCAVPS